MRLTLVFTIACAGCTEGSVRPIDETTPDARDCRELVADGLAQVLVFDEAELRVPEGAGIPGDVVELCVRDTDDPDVVGRIWTTRPLDRPWTRPLELAIEAQTADERMIVPGPDGPRSAVESLALFDGFVVGPLYRSGDAWSEVDARRLDRYPAPQIDILLVLDWSTCNNDNHDELAEAFATEAHPEFVRRGLDARIAVTTDAPASAPVRPGGELIAARGRTYVTPDDDVATLRQMMAFATDGGGVNDGVRAAADAFADHPAVFRSGASRSVLYSSDFPDVPATPPVSALLQELGPDPSVHLFTELPSLDAPYQDAARRTDGVVHDWSSGMVDAAMARVAERWLTDAAEGLRLLQPADPSTLEVWWIPFGEEPLRVADADVTYARGGLDLRVALRDRPHEEVVVLWEPDLGL